MGMLIKISFFPRFSTIWSSCSLFKSHFSHFFPQLSQGSPEHQKIRVVCEELKHHIPKKIINPRDWEILGKNQLGNPWKNERKILKKKKIPSGFEGVMQIYCIFLREKFKIFLMENSWNLNYHNSNLINPRVFLTASQKGDFFQLQGATSCNKNKG